MTIAIIGGGAAGLMAAATILEELSSTNLLLTPSLYPQGALRSRGGKILLFDKNPGLGAKVIISGGGRCNVTTSITSIKELKQKYIRGADFLDHALKSFTPKSIYKRFEDHDVALKIEKDGRVFPVSDNGKDIVRIFENMFSKNGIDLHCKEGVEKIDCFIPRNDTSKFSISTKQGIYKTDAVIITTGGNAYTHTGSTGDGYSFARELGHSITPLGPSLNSFITLETRPHNLSGTVFSNGGFKLLTTDNGQPITISGPVLCTHFGISGPATFAMSAQISYETVSKEQPYILHLIPDTTYTYEQRNELFLWKEKGKGPLVVNKLGGIFSRKTAEILVSLVDISLDTPLHELKVEDRKRLCHLLADGIPLSLIQRRPGDEFVTAGGVNTDEVDPKTMESKITPGLYFAGEILNVDGLTGGFNLTSSWATGRATGLAIARKLTNFGVTD